MVGHLTAWNYFQTTDTPENKKFVAAYKAKYGDNRVTDDPIEAGYFGSTCGRWRSNKAGSTDVEKVRAAAKGLQFQAPEGTGDDRRREPAHLQDGPHRQGPRRRPVQGDLGIGQAGQARSVPGDLPWGGEFAKEKKKYK